MGKLNKLTVNFRNKNNKKMSQRKSTTTASSSKITLKRSKSVRASLRSISTRFLHHKSDELLPPPMQKSPSLSSLKENTTRNDFKRNYFSTNFENLKKIDFRFFDTHNNNRDMVETILKTPQDISINSGSSNSNNNNNNSKPFKSHLIMGFKKKDFILSTPPSIVAPKAAAVLHIPIKENCETTTTATIPINEIYHDKQITYNNNNYKFSEFDDPNFHRNTLRLSITSKARRTSLFHSTSTFSYASFIYIIYFLFNTTLI